MEAGGVPDAAPLQSLSPRECQWDTVSVLLVDRPFAVAVIDTFVVEATVVVVTVNI